MDNNQMIAVEVAYALRDKQLIIPVQVKVGTTALDAVQQSGILEKFPEINLEQNKIGVFSKLVKPDTVLQEKDRVEIYRSLIADPKESRRARADKKGRGEAASPAEEN